MVRRANACAKRDGDRLLPQSVPERLYCTVNIFHSACYDTTAMSSWMVDGHDIAEQLHCLLSKVMSFVREGCTRCVAHFYPYSGYEVNLPKTLADSQRPIYGGTCYSGFGPTTTFNVVEYNTAGVVKTSPITYSVAGQVYAHVMDGYSARNLTAPVSIIVKRASDT